jgi:hypothetical protein
MVEILVSTVAGSVPPCTLPRGLCAMQHKPFYQWENRKLVRSAMLHAHVIALSYDKNTNNGALQYACRQPREPLNTQAVRP